MSVKDWAGNEVSRVYADQWGIFNGLAYSSWGVNPPDPSGFVPQMFVMCMNDRGTGVDPDPLYSDSYSQFCYEWPMMPGETVVSRHAGRSQHRIRGGLQPSRLRIPGCHAGHRQVTSPGYRADRGSARHGHTLTINALGDQDVSNYGYSGPSASTAPFNQKTITRHYGFGSTQTESVIDRRRQADCGADHRAGLTRRSPVTVPDECPDLRLAAAGAIHARRHQRRTLR